MVKDRLSKLNRVSVLRAQYHIDKRSSLTQLLKVIEEYRAILNDPRYPHVKQSMEELRESLQKDLLSTPFKNMIEAESHRVLINFLTELLIIPQDYVSSEKTVRDEVKGGEDDE